MNIIKKLLGKILYYIAKNLSFILDAIITIINITVNLVRSIANGFSILIGMGGCLLIFMFLGSFGLYMLTNPTVILIILFFIIFPILGTKFISLLKYIKYMLTEFLFDRANHLMYGTKARFGSFSEYGYKYKRSEEANKRNEQRQKQEQQQKEWQERFRQWQENQYGNFGGYGYDGNYQNNSSGQDYSNPTVDFKNNFQESCNLLDVPYNADKYQIKLAYHKKAKEYHPDINKSPNATEMFRKINTAYEFLSDDNIQRYKNMN